VLQAQQDLRVGGRNGAAQYQYTLIGDDFDELNVWAPRVLQKLRSCGNWRTSAPISRIVDWTRRCSGSCYRGALRHLRPDHRNNTLYDAFGQRQVSTMYTPLNQYHVVMKWSRGS